MSYPVAIVIEKYRSKIHKTPTTILVVDCPFCQELHEHTGNPSGLRLSHCDESFGLKKIYLLKEQK